MSTIASPRPSISLSSRRGSASTDRSASTSRPGGPGPATGSLRRNRADRSALRDYYNLKAGDGDVPPTPTLDVQTESELDTAGFNADEYVRGILAKESLEGVLRVEAALIGEVRTLDGEKKALVYDNYSKLIAATDTIRKMRMNMDPLTPMTGSLEEDVGKIAESAKVLSEQLRKQHGASGSGAGNVEQGRNKQETVKWVLHAPARLQQLVRDGRRGDAVRQWTVISGLLDRWGHVEGSAKPHRLLIDDERLHHLAATAQESDPQQLAYAYNIMMMAHEIDYAIGLQHEHQRPDAYGVYNQKDASLVLHLERFERYDAALRDIMTGNASDDATLRELSALDRLVKVFGEMLRATTYWRGRNIVTLDSAFEYMSMTLVAASQIARWISTAVHNQGRSYGGPFNYQSIMLYSSIHNAKRNANGEYLNIYEDASVSWPDSTNPRGIGRPRVWTCGVEDSRHCTGPSSGDIQRVIELYPPTNDPGEGLSMPFGRPRSKRDTVSESAFSPLRVIVQDYTTTIRPLPARTLSVGSNTGTTQAEDLLMQALLAAVNAGFEDEDADGLVQMIDIA
ncbi:hypothetical protein LTR95_000756 [Oleoguttula sp. CCFEE 5521]